ncbi:hypothetical protein [Methylobacterium nigriterrae]|uniref:hypothetical protein n=1 Tax=Methylobacterium nigriterrae TaxID=3127512 RepID=UPI00301394E3
MAVPSGRSGQGEPAPEGEVRPLFPEQGVGPFRSTTDEQSDIRFLKRYGPKQAPVDMRQFGGLTSKDSSPSALSKPENFIAEGYARRMLHRVIGRKRWPLLLIAGGLGAGIAVLVLDIRLPAPLARFDLRTAEMPAGPKTVPAEAPRTADLRPTQSQPAGPPPTSEPFQAPPAAPAPSAADLEKQLVTSGLPPQAADPFAMGAAKVTAFPPAPSAREVDPPTQSGPAPVAPAESKSPPDPARTEPRRAAAPERDLRKLDGLVARGEQLLVSGEIAAARLFFGRAATEGDPRGARGVAKTYDERVLKTLPVLGLTGNRAEAERWYLKAVELEAGQAGAGR